MKNGITLRTTILTCLLSAGAVFYAGFSAANSETASPFENKEFFGNQDISKDEMEALADELIIEFDLFMADTFKQMSEFYPANNEQKSKMRPEKDATLLNSFNNFIDTCTSEFDASDQLASIDCDKSKMQTPVRFWYLHPSYKNILVDVSRHKLLGDFRDPENSVGTEVYIRDPEDVIGLSGNILRLISPGQRKALLPIRGALNIMLNEPDLSCTVISFKPFDINGSNASAKCTFVLRESIAVLKKLNARP